VSLRVKLEWIFPRGNVFKTIMAECQTFVTDYMIDISNEQKYDTRFQNKLNNFSQLGLNMCVWHVMYKMKCGAECYFKSTSHLLNPTNLKLKVKLKLKLFLMFVNYAVAYE
jgi:hypothetical protein